MKTYTFYVQGMHCAACESLTEMIIKEDERVHNAKTNLGNSTITFSGEFGERSPEEIAGELNIAMRKEKYTLTLEKVEHQRNWGEFRLALPFALGFIALFVLLQKLGIVNLVTSGDVNYGTAFLIGLIASFSTCMAVVGGLVLSISANFAKEGDQWKPQILFHVGRIVSFFVLGGVIGMLGSTFALGGTGILVLSLLVGLVMLILGINLLDIFPRAKLLQFTLPKFVTRHIVGLNKANHVLTPLAVGMLTFFLPCGFTQSMQLYALSTGSFVTGAFIMLTFALGTLPMLSLFSFSSFSIKDKARSGIFFKAAGIVVIFFAVINVLSALAAAGVIAPIINF